MYCYYQFINRNQVLKNLLGKGANELGVVGCCVVGTPITTDKKGKNFQYSNKTEMSSDK